MDEIDWDSNTLDSKDIIKRHEDLVSEYEELIDNLKIAKGNPEEVLEAEQEMNEFLDFKMGELKRLESVINQGEDYGDFTYGETLINADYFINYITNIIDDCYEFTSEMYVDTWPYKHITFDYIDAAEEAKKDYVEILVDDRTFYFKA